MKSIVTPITEMQDHYEVLVIGSGYGGGIAASRLARAGQKVALLERGKEFMPGDFPNTLVESTEEMQFDLAKHKIGSDLGLFNFHVSKDISVLVGCGLGGTSLINASVGLHVDPRVFTPEKWPQGIIDDLDHGIKIGYERATEMLKPTTYPDHYPTLDKYKANQQSAEYVKQPFYKTPIYVNFEDQVNHVGVHQKACVNCGDCVTGCNYTAKNTTQMNYLPDAVNHGAKIFTRCNVSHIEKSGDTWKVLFTYIEKGDEPTDEPNRSITADVLILAAGTVGSSELMLRSKEKGLPCSDQVGYRFSGNGDVLGFSYNSEDDINGVGFGDHPPGKFAPAGPNITSIIDTRETAKDYKNGFVMEEGGIPGGIGGPMPEFFGALAVLEKTPEPVNNSFFRRIQRFFRSIISLICGPRFGSVFRTQTFLLMSHDDGDGQFVLNDKGRLQIHWPGVGREKIFQKANDFLKRCNDGLDGIYLVNPIWTEPLGDSLLSVHPIGGCIMADDINGGVVNQKGQVFDPSSPGAVYENFYISDGSVIPTSLGVNPSFTISAIAERNMSLLCKERDWTIDYSLPSKTVKA